MRWIDNTMIIWHQMQRARGVTTEGQLRANVFEVFNTIITCQALAFKNLVIRCFSNFSLNL